MSPANKSRTSGSIMVAALIVTLITATLMGLFLKTVVQEVENSHRFSMSFQAINLAEAGLDFAINAMVLDQWPSAYWEAGSMGGYYGKLDGTLLGMTSTTQLPFVDAMRNEDREVHVYIEPDRTVTIGGETKRVPAAIAEAVIRLPKGIEVRRQVYIEMARGMDSNGFWGNGILGKQGVVLGGTKQRVDSFTTYPFDPLDPDNPGNIDDRNRYASMSVEDIYDEQAGFTRLGHYLAYPNGSVASLSIKIDDISVQNADIYGRISTGASEEGTDLKKFIGPQGSLYDDEPPFESEKDDVDLGNIAYDFDAELPAIDVPVLESPTTEIAGATLGSDDSETTYHLTSLDIGNSDVLTVKGDVTLVVDGDMDVGGEMTLAEGARMKIFVKGDVTIGGTGLVNSNSPRNLIIYNTTTAGDIANGDPRPIVKLHGNGFLSAAVYAPEADISLKGGGGSGEMYGSVVGNTVTFAGNNYDFHFDQSLAFINDDDGNGGRPEVTNWLELTDGADRYDMTTILSDGF